MVGTAKPKAKAPRISREQYDLLCDSHRTKLGQHAVAARAASVSVSIATHAYNHGYGTPMPAIRKVITGEMVDARAKLAELSAGVDPEKIARTRSDIAESRAMQARALRLTRNNAIASMTISMVLLRAGASLTKRIDALMTSVDDKGIPTWIPTPDEAITLLRKITEIAKMSSEMNLAAEDAERRVLGAPDVVVAHTRMTANEAVATLSTSQRMMDRLKRRAARGELPAELSGPMRLALQAAENEPKEESELH